MRLIRWLLIFALLALPVTAAQPLRILFIGNSYTSVNNLPAIVTEIAQSAAMAKPVVKAIMPGGQTLAGHLGTAATLQTIDEGWDVVALQEQSQVPAFAEDVAPHRAAFLRGMAGLYEHIKAHNPKARIVLYETWARHADAWSSAKPPEAPLGANATEMQARLRKWYGRAAEGKADVTVAPVGDAWELNYRQPGGLRLHAADNSHPNFRGSYLAGLIIYATIYRPPTLLVSYRGNLPASEAAQLQQLAAAATKK
jgi:hypothetical protein